jgi:hypothetical protein
MCDYTLFWQQFFSFIQFNELFIFNYSTANLSQQNAPETLGGRTRCGGAYSITRDPIAGLRVRERFAGDRQGYIVLSD